MSAGADQLTLRVPLEARTDKLSGASGAAAGIIETGVEALEVSMLFVAVTVMAYVLPLMSDVRLHDKVEPSTLHTVGVSTPSSAVTVYAVIVDPLSEGAVQLTLAEELPGVTSTPVTVEGACATGVPEALLEGSEVPMELVAVTVTE